MALWLLLAVGGGLVGVSYLGKRHSDELEQEALLAAEREAESEAQQRAEDHALQRALQLDRTELQERLRAETNVAASKLQHERQIENDARRDKAREDAKERDRLRAEGFLTSLWAPSIGVERKYTFKDFPGSMTLTLRSVTSQGLKFHGVSAVVPFPLVLSCAPVKEANEDEDEEP